MSKIDKPTGYIGVLPYQLRNSHPLSTVQLNQLTWLNNDVPKGRTVADLGKQDHIVVYPSSTRLLKPFGALQCQVDLMLAEPKSIHGKYYRLIWLLRFRFSRILCRYPEYVQRYSNVLGFNVAETWVPEDAVKDIDFANKRTSCSLIASNKTELEGHKLRHEVVSLINNQELNVDVLGRGYKPFEHKQDGLLGYQYSVVIENEQEPHYFTEKLLDSMVCKTIPIYWGCPNIGDYFDVQGMIICSSLEEVIEAIKSLPAYPSSSVMEALEYNYKSASEYRNLYQRVAQAVAKDCF